MAVVDGGCSAGFGDGWADVVRGLERIFALPSLTRASGGRGMPIIFG